MQLRAARARVGFVPRSLWDRGDQLGGVGMSRPLEDIVDLALLDHDAVLHDIHAVGYLTYHAEVVRDEQVADREFGSKLSQEPEYPSLNGHVE